MANYDSSQIGVPYIRSNGIVIHYSTSAQASVTVYQALAVKLADGTSTEIAPCPPITFNLDIPSGTTAIPLVDPTTGANLGANTTLQQVMLGILAVIRQQQSIQNP